LTRVPAILTARFSSSRLPGKALMEIAGLPALLFVAKRSMFGGLTPYVFTSSDPSDDVISDLANSNGIPCFRGDLLNKVQRWADGFNKFEISAGHLIDVDDPYFDPESCSESFKQLTNDSQIEVLLPSRVSDDGEAYVGTSVKIHALEKASARAQELGFTNLDVIPWTDLLDEDVLATFSSHAEINEDVRFRLTLDYPEDYELISYLGTIFSFDSERSEIEKFLLENKELTQINLFRNEDFRKNKVDFLTNRLRR